MSFGRKPARPGARRPPWRGRRSSAAFASGAGRRSRRRSLGTPATTPARRPISTFPSKRPEPNLFGGADGSVEARRDLLGGTRAAIRIGAARPPPRPSRFPRCLQPDARLESVIVVPISTSPAQAGRGPTGAERRARSSGSRPTRGARSLVLKSLGAGRAATARAESRALRRGSGALARVQACGRGRIRPSRSPVRQQRRPRASAERRARLRDSRGGCSSAG